MEGYTYGNNQAYAKGWVCQKDYNPSITYKVFRKETRYDDRIGIYITETTQIGTATANKISNSTIDGYCRGTGSYGFSYPVGLNNTPDTVKIEIEGVSLQTGVINRSLNQLTLPRNQSPTIDNITNKITDEDVNVDNILFTVSDRETNLTVSDIVATSSNTSLIPNNNIIISSTTTADQYKIKLIPAGNKSGLSQITVKVFDGNGSLASDSFTLTVNAVNDAPVGYADTATVAEDGVTYINVVGNDTDVDGGTLTPQITNQPTNGTAIVENGTIKYSPNKDYNGGDSFQYKARDSEPLYSGATNVSIIVTAVADAPVANNFTVSTNEDNAVTINVLENASDADGDPLTLMYAGTASNGTVTINGDKTVTFTPNANFYGTGSFKYIVSDLTKIIPVDDYFGLYSTTATVTINVSAVNDAPTITAIGLQSTDEDVTKSGISFTIADVDDDISSLVVTPTSNDQTLVPNASITKSVDPDTGVGSLSIQPALNQNGPATITVKVTDAGGLHQSSQFTLTVDSVNDTPVANPDSDSTAEDTVKTISVVGNDTDADGDALTPEITNAPTNGSAVVSGNAITYSPNLNFNGDDSFKYRAKDPSGLSSNIVTVSMNVSAVNDAPIITEGSSHYIYVAEYGSTTFSLSATDAEGDILTWTVEQQANQGAASVTGTGNFKAISYDSAGGGDTDSFVIKVSDGVASDMITIDVSILRPETSENRKIQYIHTDLLGSPTAVSDEQGNIYD